MNLTIIIPVANEPIPLRQTLSSLVKADDTPEIIIVNDGAANAVSDICKQFPVSEIRNSPNRGSYHARNQGISASSSARLGFIDAGNIACENWTKLAAYPTSDADYIGDPVRMPEAKLKSGSQLYQVAKAFPVELYLKRDGYCPTANLVVQRQVFEKLGGFDERLRSSGDLEFGNRVREYGAFTQSFDADRFVTHPFRSILGLVKKSQRTTLGKRQLAALHPERFHSISPNNWKW